MSLEPGGTLAHYEILEPIGKGGMGEVFRARDTKLNRDIAIKILPDEFAKDDERLARFRREAQVLASLNHPNIAAIYGLEESDGVHYLALELVPGETLAERNARPPSSLSRGVRGKRSDSSIGIGPCAILSPIVGPRPAPKRSRWPLVRRRLAPDSKRRIIARSRGFGVSRALPSSSSRSPRHR